MYVSSTAVIEEVRAHQLFTSAALIVSSRGRIPYPLLAVHERLHVFDRPRSVVLEAHGVQVEFIGFPYAHNLRRQSARILAEASCEDAEADIRVLCLHQCIEGATCGPGSFTFRF